MRWDAALYTDKVLEPSSLDLMWTPARLSDGTTVPYGFGWALGENNDPRVVLHGGAWQGFTTLIARYIDKKLTIVVLANLSGADVSRIALGVVALYDPELAPD